MQVREIGEQGLLQRLYRFCPADLVGDDAALLSVQADQSLVVTSDVLNDGVHFSVGRSLPIATTSASDAGWRSVAANLSDLAAMGATPLGITVGLSLPDDLAVSWVEEFYQGMVDCLAPYNTPIVGGDICRAKDISVAIAAFGQVYPQQAIRRSTAIPGDVILATGVHGASRAGLELLLHPEMSTPLDASTKQRLILAHQRPRPRLDLLPIFQAIATQDPDDSRITGMDSSDGLADAVVQLCRASGVGALLDRDRLPSPPDLKPWLPPEQIVDWTLYGGEDFELILCLPTHTASMIQAQVSTATIIGQVTSTSSVILRDASGHNADEILSLTRGFQHWTPEA